MAFCHCLLIWKRLSERLHRHPANRAFSLVRMSLCSMLLIFTYVFVQFLINLTAIFFSLIKPESTSCDLRFNL